MFGIMPKKYLKTIEDLMEYDEKIVDKLLESLDIKTHDLAKVGKHLRNGEKQQALQELVNYYKSFSLEDRLPASPPDDVHIIDDDPNDLLEGKFSHYEIKYNQPTRASGRLNWGDLGPEHDKEWGYHLNRHFFVIPLLDAYRSTKDEVYAEKCDHLLQDWILTNPKPFIKSNSVEWRGLEAAIRLLLTWPVAFYGFQKSDSFSDATLLLLLSMVPKHCSYLRWWHNYMGNHLVMQMTGMATAACCFPEFRDSYKWVSYAEKKLRKELLKRQVYPDGVQKECSSHVHMFTLIHFDMFVKILEKIGLSVQPAFSDAVQKMWDYIAYVMRPNGYLPLNNDCWLKNYRYLLERKTKEANHKDWEYIITNGKKGDNPRCLSVHFPWGGQTVMRNNYSSDAHWSFFDTGPSGISPTHLHRDKLHLSIHAFGRDLLVDSGSLHHIQDKWRNSYFNSSFGHNVVIVDGKGQKAPERLRRSKNESNFISTPEYDFAWGKYDGGYAEDKLGVRVGYNNRLKGEIIHERFVVYLRGKFWIVIDHLISDRKRDIKTLWHFHPDCNIESCEQTVRTTDKNKGNLLIKPLNQPDALKVVKGQEKPYIQGWYSQKYNTKQESSCAIYEMQIDGNAINVWLLYPYKNRLPEISVDCSQEDGSLVKIVVGDEAKQIMESIIIDLNNKSIHI